MEINKKSSSANGFPFVDDLEKMRDFYELSKEDFLMSYSYLSEEEYDSTFYEVLKQLELQIQDIIQCIDGMRDFDDSTTSDYLLHMDEYEANLTALKLKKSEIIKNYGSLTICSNNCVANYCGICAVETCDGIITSLNIQRNNPDFEFCRKRYEMFKKEINSFDDNENLNESDELSLSDNRIKKEYIERKEAQKVLADDYAYNAAQLLDDIPAADVVEIVRCKNCSLKKHRTDTTVLCNHIKVLMPTEGYCCFGK